MPDNPLQGTENIEVTPEPIEADVPEPQGLGPPEAKPTTLRPRFKAHNYNQDSGGMTTESGRFRSN